MSTKGDPSEGASGDSGSEDNDASGEVAETQERLKEIEPYEFEHFVAEVWDDRGFDTEVTQGRSDGGIDVVATRDDGVVDSKTVIQAKRYTNPVGVDAVRQYAGVHQREIDADRVVLATSSRFTDGAKSEAEDLNVKLVDGTDLASAVHERGLQGVVDEYAPEPGPEAEEATTKPTSEPTADESSSSSGSQQGWAGYVSLAAVIQLSALVLLFTQGVMPAISDSMASWGFVAAWFASPYLVYKDATYIQKSVDGASASRIALPAVALMIPVLGAFYYIAARPDV